MQQNILAQYPSKKLRVYVIWQAVHADDSIERARQAAREIFRDDRVRHLWDGRNAIGLWYKQEGRLASQLTVVWDAYYLYAPESAWKTGPSHLLGLGHPVVDSFPSLKTIIASFK